MGSEETNLNVSVVLVFLMCLQLWNVSGLGSSKIERSIRIREINKRGPYIGLVTVFETEEDAFLATVRFTPLPSYPSLHLSGRRFRIGKIHGRKVVYVRCGIGLINAASTTQQMIDVFKIKGIVHFGIAGNLNNSMSIGDVTIPKQIASTGLWDWLNPDTTNGVQDVAFLDIGKYNAPQGDGNNKLGSIGYSEEELYSKSSQTNAPRKVFWLETTREWLHLATQLEGIELLRCTNSSLCLPKKPKLVVGLKGATSNIFVDNAAYRNFLFYTFGVSSSDMESSAVLMTCVSNGYPIIVIRGLSDLAGAQTGDNAIRKFGSLAATNTARVVLEFIKKL